MVQWQWLRRTTFVQVSLSRKDQWRWMPNLRMLLLFAPPKWVKRRRWRRSTRRTHTSLPIKCMSISLGKRLQLYSIWHYTFHKNFFRLGEGNSQKFVQTLEQLFKLPRGTFSNLRKENFQITFKVNPNYRELNASSVASQIGEFKT